MPVGTGVERQGSYWSGSSLVVDQLLLWQSVSFQCQLAHLIGPSRIRPAHICITSLI